MVTSGFFNAKNHDRLYDAEQMSSIFDGIIRDGVLMHYGGQLMVKASQFMTVNVETGRAWFNHTWTLNNSILPLTLDPSTVNQNRTDAIVLDVDAGTEVRKNTIKIVKGLTAIGTPARPTLIKDPVKKHWQYPLAYVYVAAGVTAIDQGAITNMVGLGDCPFVTAPLEKMNIDDLVAQWESQWRQKLRDYEHEWGQFMKSIETWSSEFKKDLNTWRDTTKTETQNWIDNFERDTNVWLTDFKDNVIDWFNKIKDMFNEESFTYILNHLATAEQNIEKIQQALDKLKGDTSTSIADLEKLIGENKKELNNTIKENEKKTDKKLELFESDLTSIKRDVYFQMRTHDLFVRNDLGRHLTQDQLHDIQYGSNRADGYTDICLGSYWTSDFTLNGTNPLTVTVRWVIIDFNYFSYVGSSYATRATKNHIVVMPSVGLSVFDAYPEVSSNGHNVHPFASQQSGSRSINSVLNDTEAYKDNHANGSYYEYNECLNEARRIFGNDHVLEFEDADKITSITVNSNNVVTEAYYNNPIYYCAVPTQHQIMGRVPYKNTVYGNNNAVLGYAMDGAEQFKLFKQHPEIYLTDFNDAIPDSRRNNITTSESYQWDVWTTFGLHDVVSASRLTKPIITSCGKITYNSTNNYTYYPNYSFDSFGDFGSVSYTYETRNLFYRPYFVIG